MTDTYLLYDYKTGEHYSKHPNLEGAMLSALFHVSNGAKVTWSGGPRVWFGHTNRWSKMPKFGIDAPKKRRG